MQANALAQQSICLCLYIKNKIQSINSLHMSRTNNKTMANQNIVFYNIKNTHFRHEPKTTI